MVRDLESKLEMISQIAQTNDEAEIKMKLIEEVLSIGSSKLSKVTEQELSPKLPSQVYAPIKHIETTKTEEIEVIPESIHVNESLPEKVATTTLQVSKDEENMSESKLMSESEHNNKTIKSMGEDE